MAPREGLPGRRRKVLAAARSVRRMFQAEERVYNSFIIAKRSSTATPVSCSVNGVNSFCARLGSGGLVADTDGRLGDCSDGAVLVDVLTIAATLSVRE